MTDLNRRLARPAAASGATGVGRPDDAFIFPLAKPRPVPPPEIDVEYDPPRRFVEELYGDRYSLYNVRQQLRDDDRVVRWADNDWRQKGGQVWNKDLVGRTVGGEIGKTQSLQSHVVEMAPEGESQKHYHQNEALMYILEGRGFEVHDGQRYEWEPGDLALIHGGCVHKHFSADPDHPARVLIIKAKPIYLFLHLIYQQYIEHAPEEPVSGQEDHEPAAFGSPTTIDLDPAHQRVFDRLAEDAPDGGHDHDAAHGHEHDHPHPPRGDDA